MRYTIISSIHTYNLCFLGDPVPCDAANASNIDGVQDRDDGAPDAVIIIRGI